MTNSTPNDIDIQCEVKDNHYNGDVTIEVTATVRRAIRLDAKSGMSKAQMVEVAMQRMKYEFDRIFR
jgi:hypothetical protein